MEDLQLRAVTHLMGMVSKEVAWREIQWRFTGEMEPNRSALRQQDEYRFQFYQRENLNLNGLKVIVLLKVSPNQLTNRIYSPICLNSRRGAEKSGKIGSKTHLFLKQK